MSCDPPFVSLVLFTEFGLCIPDEIIKTDSYAKCNRILMSGYFHLFIKVDCNCDTLVMTFQVERELIETPMHLSQYRTVINELREEIARLKTKMKDDRSRYVKIKRYCVCVVAIPTKIRT